MPQGDWWPMPWFGMIMAPLMMVIFLVVAFVIVPLMHSFGMGPPWWHGHDLPPASQRTPLDILNERFARGEIDKAEYEEKRRFIAQGCVLRGAVAAHACSPRLQSMRADFGLVWVLRSTAG